MPETIVDVGGNQLVIDSESATITIHNPDPSILNKNQIKDFVDNFRNTEGQENYTVFIYFTEYFELEAKDVNSINNIFGTNQPFQLPWRVEIFKLCKTLY